MAKVIIIIVIVLLIAVAIYLIWSALGRTAGAAEPSLYLDDVSSFGVDTGSGNLVSIQPYMEPADYASAARYRAKIDGYLREADAQGWLRPTTIVVFPEFLGTWLVLANEKADLYEAETLEEALQFSVISNLPAFAINYLNAVGEDKIRDTLFRMKAADMANIHGQTFAGLARQYGVTIVSGSLILPSPAVEAGELAPGSGALQNITPVFRPDGTLYPELVRKNVLTKDEAAFMSPGQPEELPIFETPAGRLGVLICADSWYPTNYAALRAREPEIIVVPNNFISHEGWDEVFMGWNPGPPPEDVDTADIGRISEGEARLKYTLDGRMQEIGSTTGLHVFLRGSIWDLTSHGHTIIFSADGIIEADQEARGAVINYWLPEKDQ